MQSAQESRQELEAAIRYAENAISSAKTTIESMEFRQEMAKKQRSEQTGREESLTKLVKDLEEANEKLAVDNSNLERELDKLRKEKEASSGPCGCQAYRDLEEARGRAEGEVELLQRSIAELEERVKFYDKQFQEMTQGGYAPTMPVIPKDVAIAIFREGIQTGVLSACSELEGQTIMVEENEYVRNFEVSFTKEIDLDDEIDLDWMRDKCGDYSEDAVIDSLKGLCADNKFECRIHGIDDQETQSND